MQERQSKTFKFAVLALAQELGMTPSGMRDIACQKLSIDPDPNNLSDYPCIWWEVTGLLLKCQLVEAYDVAEAIHARLWKIDQKQALLYEERLNEICVEICIGCRMQAGKMIVGEVGDLTE